MSIETVKDVVIDSRGGYKFIVAVVYDSERNTKTVVRANQNCEYHRDILELLGREIRPLGLTAACLGGGQIKVDPEGKRIEIWGRSGDFGRETNRTKTATILQEAYPGFRIIAE